jgi:hypothetical protein
MTSSRESFAWPGQNWPEWLWCEKGIIAAALSLWGIYGTGAGTAVSCLIADKRVSMITVQIQSEEKSGILLGSNQGQTYKDDRRAAPRRDNDSDREGDGMKER